MPFSLMLRTLLALVMLALPLSAFELPSKSTQCVVAVASDWGATHVTLTAYEKRGNQWVKALGPWPCRIGKSGLAWGLGIHPNPPGTKLKKEGDWRAPAGVFHLGGAWGYDEAIQKHPKLPYRQITKRDLWVEDSNSPSYNRHLVIDHEPSTAWEKKQQMRQGDHAHSLKLFVAHNAPPKVTPGGGSAIFFHIWRAGGTKPTAGCTTLSEDHLSQLIAWLDPTKQPLYVLLPQAEYDARRSAWKLP
ncbi:L,D-transpeptidase family protein [Haloferula sp.]|uniref:L,D-transpeptidase family protein n=1 Tax=Haloferula sp. TaxID=2497595 RepID=UPI003C74E7A6